MPKQIDELMALADDYADWAEAKGKGHPTYAESRQALQSALEAALNYPLPDDLYDSKDWRDADYAGRVEWLHTMYEGKKAELDAHLIGREQIYTAAPPAQTPPPRLTDDAIEELFYVESLRDLSFARAIETAVRTQFGVQE